LLPPLSLFPFINRNLDEKFAVLQRGPTYNLTEGVGYTTLKEAAEDGAIVLAYG
jgi:large conductance mechanosensitive channel